MKKRILSVIGLIGVLLVTLFILTGCNSNSQNPNEENSNNENSNNENISKDNLNYNTKGNINGNIATGAGQVAVQGEWIYYAIPRDGGLYKMKLDGTENQKLIEEDWFSRTEYFYINVSGEWIYYYTLDTINKVKIDGTEKQELTSCSRAGSLITVVDGWVYYNNNDGINRIKTDGTERQLLSPRYECNGNISDGWIYCYNFEGIYKMKTDGTDVQQIYSADRVDDIIVDENWIYFIPQHDQKLYRIKIDGTDVQAVGSEIIGYATRFNVYDGWVYYNYEDKLYKMKGDGTEKQKILDYSALRIDIAGDWLFCTHNYGDSEFYKIKTDGTEKQVIEKL